MSNRFRPKSPKRSKDIQTRVPAAGKFKVESIDDISKRRKLWLKRNGNQI